MKVGNNKSCTLRDCYVKKGTENKFRTYNICFDIHKWT